MSYSKAKQRWTPFLFLRPGIFIALLWGVIGAGLWCPSNMSPSGLTCRPKCKFISIFPSFLPMLSFPERTVKTTTQAATNRTSCPRWMEASLSCPAQRTSSLRRRAPTTTQRFCSRATWATPAPPLTPWPAWGLHSRCTACTDTRTNCRTPCWDL